MRYVSTRGNAPVIGFEEALLAGLARDGGLYVPEHWPVMSSAEIAALEGQPYETVAFEVLSRFTGSFDDAALRDLIDRAYSVFGHRAVAPLHQIDEGHWLMELFHGPTLAFKDVAMQLIGLLFDHVLELRDERVTIVGATSGDTGSAAIEAFRGKARADVFILYPHGRISEVQRRQMTTPTEANVHALSVHGDFDDCQALVKAMFNDHAFRDEMRLGAINSINWTRVLAQSVYYATSSLALGGAQGRKVSYSVPTGNFGDVFAGYVAKQMGFPIDRLIVATNENDILHRTISGGDPALSAVTPTITPSMDIQVSSNFERLLFDVCDRDGAAVAALMEELKTEKRMTLSQGHVEHMRSDFDSTSVTQGETASAMYRINALTGMVIDPHTGVGVVGAERFAKRPTPMVTLSTAHPAKFPAAVHGALGVEAPLPKRMGDLYQRPERINEIENDLAAIQGFIRERTR